VSQFETVTRFFMMVLAKLLSPSSQNSEKVNIGGLIRIQFIFLYFVVLLNSVESSGSSRDFSVPDSARWPAVSATPLDFGSHLYKYRGAGPNQFVVTRVMQVHEKTFSRSLETSLDEVQENRSRFLELFGISHYAIINHEKMKSDVTGFDTVDVLLSRYRDPKGNIRHAIEYQYVKGSNAYIVTYISESRSLNNADLEKIKKTLLQFRPLTYSKLHALNSLMDWWIDCADADEIASSQSQSQLPTPAIYTPGAPLPAYCKDVPAEDKRGPNEAEIQPKLDSAAWEDCKSNLKKGATEILDTLNKIDRATGPDRIQGTLEQVGASVGSLATSFYNDPGGMSKTFLNGIYNYAKKTASSAMETTQCLNAGALQKRLCKALPSLVAGGALGKLATGGKAAVEGAEEIAKAVETGDAAKSAAVAGLKDVYAKAPAAKQEIDGLASQIADQYNGSVATAPLKGEDRALQKVMSDYGGDASGIKDVARNTVVIPQDDIGSAVDTMKSMRPDAKIKIQDATTNDRGWTGVNVTVPTNAGIPAEIQINSPEMIYAGFQPDQAKKIIGDATYKLLEKKTGLPGGLSHLLYEQVRTLPADSPKAAEVKDLCRKYHNLIRDLAAGKNGPQYAKAIKDFKQRLQNYIRQYDPNDQQLEELMSEAA
jgi:hypothetical protein